MPQQESEVVLNACDAFSERRNWVLLDLMFTGEGLFSYGNQDVISDFAILFQSKHFVP